MYGRSDDDFVTIVNLRTTEKCETEHMNDTRPILLLVSISLLVSNLEFVPPYSRSASPSYLSFATIFSAALRSEADHVSFRVSNGCLLAELGAWIPFQRPKLEDNRVALLGSHQECLIEWIGGTPMNHIVLDGEGSLGAEEGRIHPA